MFLLITLLSINCLELAKGVFFAFHDFVFTLNTTIQSESQKFDGRIVFKQSKESIFYGIWVTVLKMKLPNGKE